MSLSSSVRQVIDDLQNAEREFKTSHGPYGSALAIQAAVDFLTREGVPQSLMIPLMAVIADMADRHNEGNQKPILEAMQWGRAAGAVTVLKNSGGMKLSEAAAKVARAAGRAFSANQIIEFRKNIHKRRASAEAVDEYYDMVKTSKTRPSELREGIALRLIEQICAEGKKG